MNKYLVGFLLLLLLSLFGCHKNEKRDLLENVKWSSHHVDEEQLEKTVRQLADSNKSDQALKLIDTLIYFNKKNGFLYYERGYVEGYNFHHAKALRDFKIAESLHYSKMKCQFMIGVCEDVINEKIR